jgi:hypothetical protein
MDENIYEYDDELDCEVTIFDGSYMTCDMAEEEPYEEIEIYKDFDI